MSVQPFGVHREQRVDARPQHPALGLFQGGILRHPVLGRLLRLVQQPHVAAEVGDFQRRQAVLPLAEKVAGAADGQVLP